jgi:quercetin dioxygenase-like cupin family protein
MSELAATIRRWPEPGPPSEPAIRRLLDAEGLKPDAWSNAPGDEYPAHSHGYDKVIYVVRGSISFGLPNSGGKQLKLRAGDRLDLPRGVVHDAFVGPEGVVCLEAHR